MTERAQVKRVFAVGLRTVTITAYEQVGPEDCMSMLIRGVLHKYVTGEDVVPAIGRDVKDALIRGHRLV
jgi:hypothetical protein